MFANTKKIMLYNIYFVLIFGFLYWLNDWFITNNPDIAVKYMHSGKGDGKVDSLLYYMWYSLITQTTVGYGGVIDSKGNTVPFSKEQFWTFKLLNIMQLSSIFLTPIIVAKL